MVLQHPGDGHRMLRVFLGYDCQVADLEFVVRSEILEGVLVVLGNLI